MEFTEIIYEKREGIATITINRPEKYNACTPVTIYELTQALTDAWVDTDVGVVVLTGAGDKAFCTGGDQSIRDKGGYGGTVAALPLEVGWQQVSLLIRTIPKPVIARVNGLCHRRGQRFPGGVRPLHCLRDGPVRPGRPPGGKFRSRLRHGGPRPGRGDEEGQGDLVSVPALHGQSRRWTWAWSTPLFRRTNWMKKSENGAGNCWKKAPLP